ncbi:MAG: DNA-processing protein DprA [Candidatus Saccharibacteria bacterium]|nr:DNA-processing protein DprA [Candidatus Saccharibacteria bacterium]
MNHKQSFAINPLEEAIAYEAYIALEKDRSEQKLEQQFQLHNTDNELIQIQANQPTISQFLDELHISSDYHKLKQVIAKELKKGTGFSICTFMSYHYPQKLRDNKYPLKLFYYRGDINLLDTRCVSIVGSRQASEAGLKDTQQIAQYLIEKNYTIISGLAQGIDTVALTTAIKTHGRIIGVIGTPIDQYYPKDNKDLQDEIGRRHLLLSHVPFYKYDKEPFSARRNYFPQRNIIMASISQATIIVEASNTSGTLHQAKAALDQGRQLFILDRCFKTATWPARFERQGAIKINNIDDIKENF